MKVFLTGASGYIGRHVVKELLVNGHEVIASDVVKVNQDGVIWSDTPIFLSNRA